MKSAYRRGQSADHDDGVDRGADATRGAAVDARPRAQERSVERTIRWARRCRDEFDRQVAERKDVDPPLIFAVVQGGELFLLNLHIPTYEQANQFNHEPTRTRKLLLHRDQIDQLLGKTKAKGLTLVPLKLYITARGKAKLVGICFGHQAMAQANADAKSGKPGESQAQAPGDAGAGAAGPAREQRWRRWSRHKWCWWQCCHRNSWYWHDD